MIRYYISRNQLLQEKNNSYFSDATEYKTELESLKKQLDKTPQISFKSLGLMADVQDVPINKNNSYVNIDGKEYFSREITEKLLPDNQKLTIKDDTIFIGTVIAEKSDLIGKNKLNQSSCDEDITVTDSYGNTYSKALYFYSSKGGITYVLNEKYAMIRFTLAISQNSYMDRIGTIIIKADDAVVYTSKELTKTTEPFTEIDIPINNCKLLEIEYNSDIYNYCIMTGISVYN